MELDPLEIEHLHLLKQKKPIERFLMMAQLIQTQIEAMKAGIRYRFPAFNEEEVHRCLQERMMQIYSWKH
jgi:hypothetical protein